ncbi:hypothetical protein [Candidatus Electrothrix sp.]|uniref:hypothetical protein n=1 Tax=Candidatus Electrothrix sp. TaxID=2170559 RepID=UPI0040578C14
MRIPVADTQKRLTSIWFSGSVFLFTLLVLQTILGKYGSEARQAWILILLTFTPTLFLLLGALIAEASSPAEADAVITVDRFFFRLSDFLSMSYLSTVSLTILFSPFVPLSQLEFLQLSYLWLIPFQGVVMAALGAFLISKNTQAGGSRDQ